MQLIAEIERLNTEVAKQRYRVEGHILPHIANLRAENERLKTELEEHHSSTSVSGVSSGVSNLKLSSAEVHV